MGRVGGSEGEGKEWKVEEERRVEGGKECDIGILQASCIYT